MYPKYTAEIQQNKNKTSQLRIGQNYEQTPYQRYTDVI